MDDGRVLGRERPHRTGDADPLRELGGVEQPVAVAEAEALVLASAVSSAGMPCGPRARISSPPLWKPASIPASAHTRPTSSTASYVACWVAFAASVPCSLREPAHRDVQVRGTPGAVAAGRAEAGDLALDHHDPQRRVPALQVERGPEAGHAGTQDRDVGVGGAVDPGARGARIVTGGLEPVGDGSVVAHARMVRGRRWRRARVAGPATRARPGRRRPPPRWQAARAVARGRVVATTQPEVRPHVRHPDHPRRAVPLARAVADRPCRTRTRTRRGPAR